MASTTWIPQPDEEIWVDGVGYVTCEQRTRANGAVWIWAGGVAYPIEDCSPTLYPELIGAFVEDLSQSQTWDRVEWILCDCTAIQRQQVWAACPATLRQSLWAMRKVIQPATQATQEVS